MSYYTSEGYPYIGVTLERGDTAEWPPSAWTRIEEIFELTSFPRTWDRIDFTSHDAAQPNHDLTRTSKPGLMGEASLTFRGIWRENTHAWFENLFLTRAEWPFKLTYTFLPQYQDDQYAGVAWVQSYDMQGDLGDKFLYEVTLAFNGVLQPFFPPAASPAVAPGKAPAPQKEPAPKK